MSRRASGRAKGFTFVELAVVSAIVGVLMMLLVPAIQSVRESARRSQCTSNLRQIGLALHAYFDTNQGSFPPSAPYGNGPSWAAYLLPYLGANDIYRNLRFDDPANVFIGYSTAEYDTSNEHFTENVVVPTYLCPSAVGEPLRVVDWTWGRANNPTVSIGHYVGIMGAATSATDFHDPTGRHRCSPTDSVPTPACYWESYLCYNGVFMPKFKYPDYSQPKLPTFSSITDGLSQTIIVGEASRTVTWPLGLCTPSVFPTPITFDYTMSGARGEGMWYGDSNGAQFWEDSPTYSHGQGPMTTLRWPINARLTDPAASTQGGLGPWGANQGINSEHPGGANVLLADGAVRFMSENTAWEVLRAMCIRDDGASVAIP